MWTLTCLFVREVGFGVATRSLPPLGPTEHLCWSAFLCSTPIMSLVIGRRALKRRWLAGLGILIGGSGSAVLLAGALTTSGVGNPPDMVIRGLLSSYPLAWLPYSMLSLLPAVGLVATSPTRWAGALGLLSLVLASWLFVGSGEYGVQVHVRGIGPVTQPLWLSYFCCVVYALSTTLISVLCACMSRKGSRSHPEGFQKSSRAEGYSDQPSGGSADSSRLRDCLN